MFVGTPCQAPLPTSRFPLIRPRRPFQSNQWEPVDGYAVDMSGFSSSEHGDDDNNLEKSLSDPGTSILRGGQKAASPPQPQPPPVPGDGSGRGGWGAGEEGMRNERTGSLNRPLLSRDRRWGEEGGLVFRFSVGHVSPVSPSLPKSCGWFWWGVPCVPIPTTGGSEYGACGARRGRYCRRAKQPRKPGGRTACVCLFARSTQSLPVTLLSTVLSSETRPSRTPTTILFKLLNNSLHLLAYSLLCRRPYTRPRVR